LSAPLAEAVLRYAALGIAPFHTPGHKGGRGAHPLLQHFFTAEGLRADVSLTEELDDLHAPAGCIRAAEELAAEAYGADAAYFMINGTTGAIHTMLTAALAPGDVLLVPRNVHRSVVGAMILTGVRPIWLQPEIDTRLGIAMGVSLAAVQRAVQEHPEARAALLVHPTYYGVTGELREIADFLHAHDRLLLTDAAHGAHFAFSEELPPSAMEAGADLSAESTHKLLGSLTQTSMLLARGGRVPAERIRAASGLLQSTSPNEILLASLDAARAQMAENGRERLAAENKPRYARIIDVICEEYGMELARITAGDPGLIHEGEERVAWHFLTDQGHYSMVDMGEKAVVFDDDGDEIAVVDIARVPAG